MNQNLHDSYSLLRQMKKMHAKWMDAAVKCNRRVDESLEKCKHAHFSQKLLDLELNMQTNLRYIPHSVSVPLFVSAEHSQISGNSTDLNSQVMPTGLPMRFSAMLKSLDDNPLFPQLIPVIDAEDFNTFTTVIDNDISKFSNRHSSVTIIDEEPPHFVPEQEQTRERAVSFPVSIANSVSSVSASLYSTQTSAKLMEELLAPPIAEDMVSPQASVVSGSSSRRKPTGGVEIFPEIVESQLRRRSISSPQATTPARLPSADDISEPVSSTPAITTHSPGFSDAIKEEPKSNVEIYGIQSLALSKEHVKVNIPSKQRPRPNRKPKKSLKSSADDTKNSTLVLSQEGNDKINAPVKSKTDSSSSIKTTLELKKNSIFADLTESSNSKPREDESGRKEFVRTKSKKSIFSDNDDKSKTPAASQKTMATETTRSKILKSLFDSDDED